MGCSSFLTIKKQCNFGEIVFELTLICEMLKIFKLLKLH